MIRTDLFIGTQLDKQVMGGGKAVRMMCKRLAY